MALLTAPGCPHRGGRWRRRWDGAALGEQTGDVSAQGVEGCLQDIEMGRRHRDRSSVLIPHHLG